MVKKITRTFSVLHKDLAMTFSKTKGALKSVNGYSKTSLKDYSLNF